MEFIKRKIKLFIISGKARSGKDTASNIIKDYYKDKNTIIISFGHYIKDYAKRVSNWDGNELNKPRELLQNLGTNVIREQLGKDDLFIKRMIDDIEIFECFYDAIIISDCRLKKEVDDLKAAYPDDLVAINIFRPDFDNGLTEEQKKHKTEIDLDDYDNFDEKIINTTLEGLEKDAENIYIKYEK